MQAKTRPARILPRHRDGEFLAVFVGVVEMLVGGAVFVDETGDLHVEAAVFGDFQHLAFAEPADSLQALAGFFHPQGALRDGVQGKPVPQSLLQLHQHVQRAELAGIEEGLCPDSTS